MKNWLDEVVHVLIRFNCVQFWWLQYFRGRILLVSKFYVKSNVQCIVKLKEYLVLNVLFFNWIKEISCIVFILINVYPFLISELKKMKSWNETLVRS